MQRDYQVRAQTVDRRRLPVIVVGLGPIGIETAQLIVRRCELFRLQGAIDVAPRWLKQSLREVLGPDAPRGRVRADIPRPLQGEGIAIATTTSSLATAQPLFESLLKQGWHVVSSTEELSCPHLRDRKRAESIDRVALKHHRCIVGTGINPGYAMDVWPLTLASNMQQLESVQVLRIVDASKRRGPLQEKIGSNMTRREFEARAEKGTIGHVGLLESAAHIASQLGWDLDHYSETLRPKIAKQAIRTSHVDVAKGRVCGIIHRVVATQSQVKKIDLELQMYLGAKNPKDEVRLAGEPPLHCLVSGGFHGDRTTVAQLVSTAGRIMQATPGLCLASSLPAPRFAARPKRLYIAHQGSV